MSGNERIDHASKARKHLEYVGDFDEADSRDWPLVNAAVAQAHAALALVEQQRIANLIALTRLEHADGIDPRDALGPFDTSTWEALNGAGDVR